MYKYYEIARNEKGLKDYDVCKKTGISAGTISDWKNGRIKTLKPDKLVLIANVLDVSVDYLTTGQKTPSEPLSASERELLHVFRSLNAVGRSEALRRISEMAKLNEYIKEQSHGKVG